MVARFIVWLLPNFVYEYVLVVGNSCSNWFFKILLFDFYSDFELWKYSIYINWYFKLKSVFQYQILKWHIKTLHKDRNTGLGGRSLKLKKFTYKCFHYIKNKNSQIHSGNILNAIGFLSLLHKSPQSFICSHFHIIL